MQWKSLEITLWPSDKLCDNHNSIYWAFYIMYYSNQSFKDKIDAFINDFNISYDCKITFSELFSPDYDNKKIDLEKARFLNKFFDELLNNFNLSIYIREELSVNVHITIEDNNIKFNNLLEQDKEDLNKLSEALTQYITVTRDKLKKILDRENIKLNLLTLVRNLDKGQQQKLVLKIVENIRSNEKFWNYVKKLKWKTYSNSIILKNFLFWLGNKSDKADKIMGYIYVLLWEWTTKINEEALILIVKKLSENTELLDWIYDINNWVFSYDINDGWLNNNWENKEKSYLDSIKAMNLNNQRKFIREIFLIIYKRHKEKLDKRYDRDFLESDDWIAKVLSIALCPIKKEDKLILKSYRKAREFLSCQWERLLIEKTIYEEDKRLRVFSNIKEVLSNDNRLKKLYNITIDIIIKYFENHNNIAVLKKLLLDK